MFEEPAEEVITNLTLKELKKRLFEYQLLIKNLESKYNMNFEQFIKKNIVKKNKYLLKWKKIFVIGI